MVTVGMNYRVLPGKEQAFEKMFAGVVAALEAAPGHTRSRLYRDVADGQSYLILSEWSDRAAFDGFLRSPEFAKVANWGKQNILAERPRHDVFER